MNRCPITFEKCGTKKYSTKGLRLLSRNLQNLNDFPYSSENQRNLAQDYCDKLSIQGVQLKLSVRLNAAKGVFEPIACGGIYILKPQHAIYSNLPENEDITMRLADTVGIEVPLHGMIYCIDESFSYFIKRFDRHGHGKKRAVEDFAQLTGSDRHTKYKSSIEKVVGVVNKFCSFPKIELEKVFRRILFSFFIGNEDMHLKNFSLICQDAAVKNAPAYDLLNTTIVLKSKEEMALPLHGKKRNLTRNDFIDYLGQEVMKLNIVVIHDIIDVFEHVFQKWEDMISQSFMPIAMQKDYINLVNKRKKQFFD